MTEKELQDWFFTLEICEKSLPSDAHPVHYKRIREIKEYLQIQAKISRENR